MEPETGDPVENSAEFPAGGGGGESVPGSSRAPRLFIREMVMRNFKSYAGEQRVGPFHKVRASPSLTSYMCVRSWFDWLILGKFGTLGRRVFRRWSVRTVVVRAM